MDNGGRGLGVASGKGGATNIVVMKEAILWIKASPSRSYVDSKAE